MKAYQTEHTELSQCAISSKLQVVYVARDPRDVVVSYFHHHRLIRNHEFVGDFDEFLDYFLQEKVLWSPFWKHIAQAWKERNSDNVLFVFFSDMKKVKLMKRLRNSTRIDCF